MSNAYAEWIKYFREQHSLELEVFFDASYPTPALMGEFFDAISHVLTLIRVSYPYLAPLPLEGLEKIVFGRSSMSTVDSDSRPKPLFSMRSVQGSKYEIYVDSEKFAEYWQSSQKIKSLAKSSFWTSDYSHEREKRKQLKQVYLAFGQELYDLLVEKRIRNQLRE